LQECDYLLFTVIEFLLLNEGESSRTLPDHHRQSRVLAKKIFGSLVLLSAPKLEHYLPVARKRAIEVTFRLLELRLEAGNIKAQQWGRSVSKLLEGGVRHVGLFLIGIPNALLWAVLTLILRFLPYVGLWISAFFPLLLSIAISTGWKEPILTLALYVSLEVLTNNFVEPFVLGHSTGMSPLAIIVSALFWTWLWGPIGLLLATPLTACLVVLGRYFPAFNVCSVLLAAEPPSSSETQFILLLTENRLSEAKALLQALGGMQLSVGIAEGLILPTLRAIENDLYPGTNATKSRIYEQLRELIEEMTVEGSTQLEPPPEPSTPKQPGTAIVPFMGEGDEIVGRVIARLLAAKGIDSDLLSWRTLRAEKVERLKKLGTPWILLSAIESRSVLTVGRMASSIKLAVPDALILVGLWSLPTEGAARWVKRIKKSTGSALYTNIDQAVEGIASRVPRASDEFQAGTENTTQAC